MIYILLSFFIGASIVMNRVLNGKLAKQEGMVNGTIINFMMALAASLIACMFISSSMAGISKIRTVPVIFFLGGILGVAAVFLFNIVVYKVSAFYVTVLSVVGQMLAGSIIDYAFFGVFSKGKIIGSIFFLVGLIINARVDAGDSKQALE